MGFTTEIRYNFYDCSRLESTSPTGDEHRALGGWYSHLPPGGHVITRITVTTWAGGGDPVASDGVGE